MVTRDSLTIDFYPKSPQDTAEVLLKNMVERRERAHKTLGISIADFSDFKGFLAKDVASVLNNQGRFITAIYIWGHGNPGYFRFGSEYIGAKNLKDVVTGCCSEHIVPFSTIYLKGCNTAAGQEGKEFMHQLGRVVFGGIVGYIWGNTREVMSLMGVDQSSGSPVEYRYPE